MSNKAAMEQNYVRSCPTTIRVALIDDHQLILDGLRLRIEKEPDLVVSGTAANCAEAEALVENTIPNLILMDVGLPMEGGLELTRKFSARFPGIPVLLLTGSNDSSLAHAAIDAGARGFLFKSGGVEELIHAIRCVAKGETYLSRDAAVALADSIRTPDIVSKLSPQEMAVLRGIAAGQTYKEIAATMGIGAKTVETYRARLASKTGLRSKVELARLAIRLGLNF